MIIVVIMRIAVVPRGMIGGGAGRRPRSNPNVTAAAERSVDCTETAERRIRDGHNNGRAMDQPKLVRDRIPEIIRLHGQTPIVRPAARDEYGRLLRAKLVEEVDEFLCSDDPEELADVLEVLLALADDVGVGPDRLERLRSTKALNCGRFAQRLVWLGNHGSRLS
jgi:predicted house-cleaning noncanonical NTP pyrophosphatase (MazG superfamily)